MSLLDQSMQECVMLDRRTVSDGEGGYISTYVDGARFQASVVPEGGGLDKVAQAITERLTYRVTTRRNVALANDDVFRTVADNMTYKVVLRNNQATPSGAGLDMRVTSAELWRLPN